MVQFGIWDHIDRSGLPLGQQIEDRLLLIEAYDRLGFYAYHLAEHHGTPLGLAPSPSLMMAAIAQRSTRLRFGPLVYCLPLYHPIRLIEEICMLDHMSGGRLELGVGRGVSPIEVGFYGVDPTNGHRQFAEALAVIRQGLTSEAVTYHGEFYEFEQVPMVLQPVQRPHPPLWYGVIAPETTAWAAANDANIVTLVPAAGARAITDRYRAEWQALGKPMERVPRMGLARHMVLADTEAEAREVAERAYRPWRRLMEWLWLQHGIPFPLGLPTEFEPLREHGGAFAGTAARAREYIAEQVEATGVNYFVCDVAFGDLTREESLRTTELLGREVLPAFQESEAVATA
jgi:alkanesulfonate monooxygenase SsuD/methylene tetrahydromethanopterin reductase-like flavin-dependent oxidoreductase (luciferase family)